jgi:hypothetical protein
MTTYQSSLGHVPKGVEDRPCSNCKKQRPDQPETWNLRRVGVSWCPSCEAEYRRRTRKPDLRRRMGLR